MSGASFSAYPPLTCNSRVAVDFARTTIYGLVTRLSMEHHSLRPHHQGKAQTYLAFAFALRAFFGLLPLSKLGSR